MDYFHCDNLKPSIMETGTYYMYDGSFQGFLTAVGQALEGETPIAGISRAGADQPPLFANVRRVLTHRPRAERLWQKLEKRSPSLARVVYFSYLSEATGMELLIYNYLHVLFTINESEESHLTEWRQRLESAARRVETEKRELERNLSFTPSADGIPCACASPATNVLPLLTRYYKSHFAGQAWMLYDTRRKYGVLWNGGQLELIGLRPQATATLSTQEHPGLFRSQRLQSLLLPKVFENSLPGNSGTSQPIRNAV